MKTYVSNGMTYVNLTPHAIMVLNPDGTLKAEIPASGELARIASDVIRVGEDKGGIPRSKPVYGEIEGLPEPKPNTVYIVSGILADKTNRMDVTYPLEQVRDDKGRVIGCYSLKE